MRVFILLLLFLASHSQLAEARQSLDLTVGGVGLSIGDSEEVTGVRLNFRDRAMKRVNGVNATIWMPYKDFGGDVHGIALGLPVTGVDNLNGIGYGILGIGANRDIEGIAFGGLGAGAGRDVKGLAFGGLGVGAGRDVQGIAFGGLGAGAGRDFKGIAFGGLGVGAGEDVIGVMIGGLGAGAGQDVKGILVSGLGAGAGRDMVGLAISGIGSGAGRDFTGISMSGIATGAGGTLKGLHMAGIAVGASTMRGVMLSGFAAGGMDVHAFSIAPAYFKVPPGGEMRGLSISSFNRIQGEQFGITIGIVNYAKKLSGYQIGLINIADNKERFRILPFVNHSK
jgi:hypothetical protein